MDNEFKGRDEHFVPHKLFLVLFLYFCEISDKMAIRFKISCFSLSLCFIFSWTPCYQ